MLSTAPLKPNQEAGVYFWGALIIHHTSALLWRTIISCDRTPSSGVKRGTRDKHEEMGLLNEAAWRAGFSQSVHCCACGRTSHDNLWNLCDLTPTRKCWLSCRSHGNHPLCYYPECICISNINDTDRKLLWTLHSLPVWGCIIYS